MNDILEDASRNRQVQYKWIYGILLTLTFMVCIVTLAIDCFTSFALWDDEGLNLSYLHNYEQGLEPYRDFDLIYGVGVYELYSHLVPGNEGFTLNQSRAFGTLFVGIAILSAAIQVGRSTRCPPASGLAILLGLLVFHNRMLEPTHPNLMIGMVVLLVMHCFSVKRIVWAMIPVGALCALLCFSKINAGILVIAGIGIALLGNSPRGSFYNYVRWFANGLALLFPLLLTWKIMWVDRVFMLEACVFFILILLTLLVVHRFGTQYPPQPQLLAAFVASLSVSLLALFAFFYFVRGLDFSELLDGLVLQHLEITFRFAYSPGLLIYLLGSSSIVLLAYVLRFREGAPGFTTAAIAFSLGVLIAAFFLERLSYGILGVLVLVLGHFLLRKSCELPEILKENKVGVIVRLWIGVFFLLYSFPVVGIQMDIALMVIVPTVALAPVLFRLPGSDLSLKWLQSHPHQITLAALLAILLVQVPTLSKNIELYSKNESPPLLKGASALRIDKMEAARNSSLMLNLNEPDFPNFLTLPFSGRFYITTNREYLTTRNRTHWHTTYDEARQRAILKEYYKYRPFQFLINYQGIMFWGGRNGEHPTLPGPMVELYSMYPEYAEVGGWKFRGNISEIPGFYGFTLQRGVSPTERKFYLWLPNESVITRLRMAGYLYDIDPKYLTLVNVGHVEEIPVTDYPIRLNKGQSLGLDLRFADWSKITADSLYLAAYGNGLSPENRLCLSLALVAPEVLPPNFQRQEPQVNPANSR